MGYRVVCISGTDGSDAAEVASAVAGALGFRTVNEEVVARAAAEAGVDHDVLADVERRKSALAKLLERFTAPAAATSPDLLISANNPVTAAVIGVGLPLHGGSHRLDSDELRGLIRSAIDEIAARGDVVIVMHAASQALAGRQGVLRVLVTAPVQTRSARLAESMQIGAKEAEQSVKNGDANRAHYLNSFYGIDHELPTHYDVVVNTDRLAPRDAATMIAALATPAPASV
jgi:cytidylate kinase